MVELELPSLPFQIEPLLYIGKAEKKVINLPCKESEIEKHGLYQIFMRDYVDLEEDSNTNTEVWSLSI